MKANKQTLGGIALFFAAALALLWANSPAAGIYFNLVHQEWIKGLAIFVFFFSVGLELRHEIQHGSLRSAKSAVVPIFAALGGMSIPVIIYSLVNAGELTSAGWGVPMSTDIAFALAVFAMVGTFLPRALRTFVMTVAVVDDSLTILMIAIFFASQFHMLSLVSLAGVITGLMIKNGEHIAKALQPWVAFVALPVFALFSAGVSFAEIDFANFVSSPITLGVLLAMVLGKPLGVLGATFLVSKSGLGKLHADIKWADLLPVGLLFGMCFTVAMLMSELSLAFNASWHATANLSVLIGTSFMAVASMIAITLRKRAHVKR